MLVSVLICTKNRHEKLHLLLNALSKQLDKRNEIIIIDDSSQSYLDLYKQNKLEENVQYIFRKKSGKISALNYGIHKCNGTLIAFTDDDCIPKPDWIGNAIKYFSDPTIIGVEGLIQSDIPLSKYREYRIVTNEHFCMNKNSKYDGFLTANMFYRKDLFDRIGNFDINFEPLYREDSDFAWRALKYGRIPFARDVVVLHPATKGEKFNPIYYQNDAYLFYKHPKEYLDYFKSQNLFKDPLYWLNLIKGTKKFKIKIPIYQLILLSPSLYIKSLIAAIRKRYKIRFLII